MAQKLYKVVETNWNAHGRVCTDIGCEYKVEKAAKEEMKQLSEKIQRNFIQFGFRENK